MEPYFSKYRGSFYQVGFRSDFPLDIFSKISCRQVLISRLVCFVYFSIYLSQ